MFTPGFDNTANATRHPVVRRVLGSTSLEDILVKDMILQIFWPENLGCWLYLGTTKI